ncbi:hypothetical protein BD779DRAFT_1573394 [Infundibulicybe gibba]|nr:hypothetical protein BD779DRAFT_1573394 [Infundibulicybe gibba]
MTTYCLGAPAASATPSPRPSRSPAPPQRSTSTRSASPPPHILGQIIEMGFSVQQARVALAATDTGVDVQSALDMLLSNTAAAPEQEREG